MNSFELNVLRRINAVHVRNSDGTEDADQTHDHKTLPDLLITRQHKSGESRRATTSSGFNLRENKRSLHSGPGDMDRNRVQVSFSRTEAVFITQ